MEVVVHVQKESNVIDLFVDEGSRRFSQRIRKLHEKRKPVYNDEVHDLSKKRKPKLNPSDHKKKDVKLASYDDEVDCGSEVIDENEMIITNDGSSSNDGLSMEQDDDHAKVTKTIRIYNKHYLYQYQKEKERSERFQSKAKVRKDQIQEVDADTKNLKSVVRRPDLKALIEMRVTGTILYTAKRLGHLPGVDVGHRFYSRAEMVAVGIHKHCISGIDFMGESYKKLEEYKSLVFPVAVSIILSGQYEDDKDNSETIIYTGQGGHDLLGNKGQISNQVMQGGNLALKNNIKNRVPVRVIRGHKCKSSYAGKVYTYDGLYKVCSCRTVIGASGFTIFKYELKRLKDQPPLTTKQVNFFRAQVPKSPSKINGLVCEGISGGLEDIPIRATNLVDKPAVAPTGYTYVKSLQVASNVRLPPNATGCKCKGSCNDSEECGCAKRNGSDFPYVSIKHHGRLCIAKNVVYECGPNCGCGPRCVNRTSQRGLKYRLEVFRTGKKGWAVRSWDFIPSGAPICEYIGRLMKTDDLDNVSENDFIFDIDCEQTMDGLDGRQRREGNVSIPTGTRLDKKKSECEYGIDAGSIGNVARFINHSCKPNLFVQCVLSSHRDCKLARVVLVAADNIPPMQELTYDYAYALGSVSDKDGNIIEMPCYCGARKCRKRLY